MADQDVPDVPEADVPEADVSQADLAWIAEELTALRHLDPVADLPDAEPMPAWVWVRLQGAIAAEQAGGAGAPAAAAATDAEVIDLASRRPGRVTRWAGGLVAASVAVLAVGVGVTAFRGGDSGGGSVVAGEIAQASALSAPADAKAFGASAAPSAAAADTQVLEAPEAMSFAGISPAQMMVASDTDYTADGLRTQVRSVLSKFGIGDKQQAETVMAGPAEVEPSAMPGPGFLSSEESLRDCITKLTEDAQATALLVDNSTYEGQEAGVVVAPEVEAPAISVPDMSTLAVWVVNEDCDILVKGFTLRMTP